MFFHSGSVTNPALRHIGMCRRRRASTSTDEKQILVANLAAEV